MQSPIAKDHSALLFDAAEQRWLLFSEPEAIYTTDRRAMVEAMLKEIEREVARRDDCYAVGFLSYEAAGAFDPAIGSARQSLCSSPCPLLWFGIYRAPHPISSALLDSADRPIGLYWRPSISKQEYHQALRKIKRYISAGQSYQANYTFRLEASLEDPAAGAAGVAGVAGSADPSDPLATSWHLFARMIQEQGRSYGAFLQSEEWIIASASPELFFELRGNMLRSRPMKGTAPRGLSFLEDQQRGIELQYSDKNRAENSMIVDMVRNDLGRIARIGSVNLERLFCLEAYPTVWQMTSEIVCQTEAGIADIFRALFPPASVTGAPKVKTVKILAELERHARALYTGAIGFLAPNRRAQFNVAIRTVIVERQRRKALYGLGSGIVWDSEVEQEWAECHAKAKVLPQESPGFSLLETMLWDPKEGYFLLEYHLKRLKQSARYFAYPFDEGRIRSDLLSLRQGFHCKAHRIRLLLDQQGNIDWDCKEYHQPRGRARLCLAKEPISIEEEDPFLYHKTTWRRRYERIWQKSWEEACEGSCAAGNLAEKQAGYDDILFWNNRGELTEASIANIVVEWKGGLYTPPISCGLLGGTYRALLLEQAKIAEKALLVANLEEYSRIYLINSVHRWRPADPPMAPC